LAWATEEFEVAAGVFAVFEALVAGEAGGGGVDCDAGAWGEILDGWAGFHNCGGEFVAYCEGVLDDLGADSAGGVIVNVRAANAYASYL